MPSGKLLWLLPLIVLSACGSENIDAELRSNSTPTEETVIAPSVGTLAAATDKDDERKLIRTADIEARVPNVLAAVTRLEQCVNAAGGTVEESHIDNNADRGKMVEYKVDSLREVKVCHTTAEMKLRVPVAQLDSVLNSIPVGAIYVERRRLTQKDVTGKYMENELMNRPGDLHSTEKALQLAEDANDAIAVQRYADQRKEQIVRRHVENEEILRDVTYSTLTVRFSQPNTVFTQVVADPNYAAAVPFGTQLSTAARHGSMLFQFVLLVLMNIWPILLIALIAFGIVAWLRKYRGLAPRS